MTFQEKILRVEPINLLEYKDDIPEFKRLFGCQQHIKWHGEGDVLTHTNMVMAETLKLCQSVESIDERINLYLGALLHDFGKPITTFEKTVGHLVAYDHEQAGVSVARDFLKKYFPMYGFGRREYILSLVEFHGHPKRMAKDESDDLRFKRLSLEVNTEQIYTIEVADFTGRIGESAEKALSYLEDFKSKCQSLDIYGKYWMIPNSERLLMPAYNLFRWNILFNNISENSEKHMKRAEELMSKEPFCLMLMVGVPGSGKTTHIEKVYPHIEKICMDDERAKLGDVNDMSKNDYVFDLCCKNLNARMKARQNTIWDATSINRKMRKRLIDIARRHGAMIGIVYFDITLETALKRNQERDRKVPEDVIEKYYKRLQVPKPYEYDKLLVVDERTSYEKKEEK